MDDPDAIPSDDDDVVIPDHLRELLSETAERMLQDACDLAFGPDARDAARQAVHCIDAFETGRVTRAVVLVLIPGTIEWLEPVKMPHTREAVPLALGFAVAGVVVVLALGDGVDVVARVTVAAAHFADGEHVP
jgi:hypothetical protein